jgi:molybdopterin-guanine dinucleotide biosynthesis protein B
MTKILNIVGRSRSGKTTLIEKIISELKLRGYSIATIKNTFHKINLDSQGKDTWRHIQAGSLATALNSPDSIMIIKKVNEQDHINEILKFYDNDYDIIIIEGYKQSDFPKIEVHRKEKGLPLENIKNIIAIVTDEKLDTQYRQFCFDDIKDISEFIVNNIIK